MNYFKLMYNYKSSDDAGFLYIDENNLNFNRYDVNEKNSLGVDKIFCKITQVNLAEYDYLANNLVWLVVSEKVKKILNDFGVINVEFIPLINSDNQNTIGYLVHCMEFIGALDERNSLCKYVTSNIDGKEYTRLSVIKYVLQIEKVKGIDMFKLQESKVPIFISEKLKKRLVREKLKGFDFLKINSLL